MTDGATSHGEFQPTPARGRDAPPRGAARRGRNHPLFQLTKMRVLEFVREPEALFWVFVFPVLLALALGIAFRERPEALPRAAVLDMPGGRALLESLRSSGQVQAELMDPEQGRRALRTGKVDVLVHPSQVPPSDNRDGVLFVYDQDRPEGRAARLAAEDALQRAWGRQDVAPVQQQVAMQPGARYIDFLIPGLIGLNLMGSGMWGLGYAVVQARNRKLLKRLAATPMRRSHFLLSFMLSRLLFLVIEVAALVVFGVLVFG
ncbi:MAG: ABC transporter permease, partial [Polyangiaceae bacterium]|nr:ABC transporter permease [Polyangiaceae bacterium]